MAGMQGLGRVFNVVPISTAGGAISMRDCSAISFVTTGSSAVATLTIATSFGGTYRAGSFFSPAWAPITTVYCNTSTTGTVAWTKGTITAASTFTHGSTTGLTASTTASIFTLFGSQMPAGYDYVKCTVTGSGIGAAITHDLTVQRAPANLAILSA